MSWGGRPRPIAIDAVTIDAYGTLVLGDRHLDRLGACLRAWGVDRSPEAVADALAAEVAFYRPRSIRGRDPESLSALRVEAAAVFLDHLGANVDPAVFAPALVDALRFRLIDGVVDALDSLRGAGLALACVANWDVGLYEHLAGLGIADRFVTIVTSAEAGAAKPDPAVFHVALDRLGVAPHRAVHVGNEEVDRVGAAAAGMAFEPAPLATLPGRLGLG